MVNTGNAFVDRFHELADAGDIAGLVALYEPDAEIVRYDGVAETPEAIEGFYQQHLAAHPGYALESVDQVRQADDVIMWDALVNTANGVLQSVHVIVLGESGLIRRHIPGMRGYWGGA